MSGDFVTPPFLIYFGTERFHINNGCFPFLWNGPICLHITDVASHSIVDILTWEITVIEMKAIIHEGGVL